MDNASLQEELIVDLSRKDVRRNENSGGYRFNSRVALPPSYMSNNTSGNTSKTPSTRREDTVKPVLSYGSPEEKRDVESQKPPSAEERVAALMVYRKAKGLCYKCGLK